jgi:hypothetical protein
MSTTIGFHPFVVPELSVEGLRKTSLDPFLSRSNYFDGRLLKAADLTRDQQYLDQRLLQAGRVLGPGVVKGLQATLSTAQQISVTPGLGITGSGRILELVNTLKIDLTDRATIATINRPPLRYFNRGLYAVVLQYAEKGVGIAETYPEDIGKTIEPRINSYEEGVALALVPLRETYPSGSELSTRAALAGKFLPRLQPVAEIPDDAVALGLLAIDRNLGQWLDRSLLYRPAGIEHEAHGFQRLLAAHYEELLDDLLTTRNWSSLGAAFSAAQYFQWLPPAGSLPKSAIDPMRALQSYFPDSYSVSVLPVRNEDLPALLEEAMGQEIIDLSRDKAVDIMVLAPLADDDFNFYARRLEGTTATANTDRFALSNRLLPGLLPLRLTSRPLRPLVTDTTQPNYWRNVWDRVVGGRLNYLRRPPRIAENHVSTVVLARGFKLPDALPASATELEQLNQRLLQAEEARNTLQAQLKTSTQQLASLNQAYTQLKAEYQKLLDSGGQTQVLGLAAQIDARGLKDKAALSAALTFVEKTADQPKLQDLTVKVLAQLDNIFDRAFWPSLLQVLAAGNEAQFLQALLDKLLAGVPTQEFMINSGPEFGMKDDSVQLWKRLADFLGV